ncbi:hypothetical protein ACFORF_06735 [Streptococcus caprae]|uniref:Uncharacterized protein n=1 Tax=Streptococcus caprae TaxID=1640501 RepID=A0ABV8CW81_9STRE
MEIEQALFASVVRTEKADEIRILKFTQQWFIGVKHQMNCSGAFQSWQGQ